MGKRRRAWGTGSQYTTKAGQHIALDRRPDGSVVRGTSRLSMADARAKLKEKLREQPSSTPSVTTETTGQYLARWLDETAPTRIRPRSMRLYRMIVRDWLTPSVGDIDLDELHADHVQRMLNGVIAAGRSPQWAHHCQTVLRSALRDAVKRRTLDANVAALVDPISIPKRPVIRLSRAEAVRLFTLNREHPHFAIWVLALTTGMRQGEILSLRWGDVNLERKTVTVAGTLLPVKPKPRPDGKRGRRIEWEFVEPKTDASRRTLELSTMAVAALAEHRQRQPPAVAPFFVFHRPDGGPLAPDWVSRRWHKALEAAGLPSVPFHASRHSAAATMLDDNDGNMHMVSNALGHASVGTTIDRYAGIARQAMKRAAEGMDRAYGDVMTTNKTANGPE